MRRGFRSGPRGAGGPHTGRRSRVLAAVLIAIGAVGGAGPGAADAATQVRTQIPYAATAAGGGTSCVPNGSGETCTGTASGDTGFDPSLGDVTHLRPTVTVDQISNLTNQMVHLSWTDFIPTITQVDGNWTNGYNAGDSKSFYGVTIFQCKGAAPRDLVADCNDQFTNQGVSQSGVQPTGVENFTQGGGSQNPGDCTMDAGDAVCGTGYADIQVQTSVENNLLGCDDTHPCSIVVIPNWGGNTFTKNCADHDSDFDGVSNYAGNGSAGEYNPCAWADRIVVPISFAKTAAQSCPVSSYQFVSEGSPTLERAMDQWRPAWCTAKQSPLSFDYNSAVNEYQARTDFLSGNAALTSSTDVALVTDPASTGLTSATTRKFTYAPVATSAISITYYMDSQTTGEPITDLKLNARLVAKLLTESYTLQYTQQCQPNQTTQTEFCDLGVIGNPRDIFHDPEFLALNPKYKTTDFSDSAAYIQGDFYPIVLAGNSDLTYELTRWVVSDPEARAFLEGQSDPWGAHVNTYYQKGQTYPVSQFEVLDPGFTQTATNVGVYSAAMQVAWNPVSGLDNVAAHLANWTSSAISPTSSCSNGQPSEPPPCTLFNAKVGPENFPTRTLFAVMDQGTAAAFRFPTAQLLNPAGNFEAPTTLSMSAAVAAMKTNPDKITQYQDFTPATYSPAAYPLTEVQYAMVPTCGLTRAKVAAISAFLTNVATSAQLYGTDPGELPPFGGYLALSDAQKAQTAAAAQAVSTQACTSPPPDTTVSGRPPKSSGSGSTNPITNPLTPSLTPGLGTPGASRSATPSQAAGQQSVGLGTKPRDSDGIARTVLVVGLVLGGLLAVGGPLTYALGTTGGLRSLRRGRPDSGGADSGGADSGGADSGRAEGGDAEGSDIGGGDFDG